MDGLIDWLVVWLFGWLIDPGRLPFLTIASSQCGRPIDRASIRHHTITSSIIQSPNPPIPQSPIAALLLQRGRRGLATAAGGGGGRGEEDAAAQRRAEALKRFGLSKDFKDTEGKPVVQTEAKAQDEGGGEGKEGKEGEEEPDWNEIWGDYVSYMDHQRTQGWKS